MTTLRIVQQRDRRLLLGTGKILSLSPKRPVRLCGTIDILRVFHWYSGRGVKVYTHHLQPKSRIRGATTKLPYAFMARKMTLPFISSHTPIYSYAYRITFLRRQICVILHSNHIFQQLFTHLSDWRPPNFGPLSFKWTFPAASTKPN